MARHYQDGEKIAYTIRSFNQSRGKSTAGVGQETFDVEIKLSLAAGRILSATIDNPVQVMERVCSDAALASCGNPERYTIHRQITLRADQATAQGVPC